jgi:hypothetical protein
MTYFKLSFVFSAALACSLVACGSDDSGNDSSDGDPTNASNGSNGATNGSNSGSGGTDSSGSGGTSSGGTSSGGTSSGNGSSGSTTGGSNACNPTGVSGSGGSPECADLSECVQRECESEYAECMGPNFASGNYSGSVCEDYLECARDCQSGDDCDTTCVLDCLGNISDACQSCLTAAGACGSESCQDEYEACSESQTTTTASSTTGSLDGTCTDLEACCESLDEDSQEACLSTLEAVQQGGDQACAVILVTYQSTGQC